MYKFFIVFLSLIYFAGLCHAKSCKINGNDLEYLNTMPYFSILNSKDHSIVLPNPYVNYDIPDIGDVILNKYKVGQELDICPPVALLNNIDK